MKRYSFLVPITLMVTAVPSHSAALLTAGFEDITTLAGDGWVLTNLSNPVGITDWFQGNDAVFSAQAGSTTSYIGANFNNTSGTGTISNWLMTPVLDFSNPINLSFWTRTANGAQYADRLVVRVSTSGTSSRPTDFSKVSLTINQNLSPSGYPQSWTEYQVSITESGTGRIAFHYDVPNGGPDGANSNYIGIDTLSITSTPIPETTNFLALGSLLIGGAFLRVRKNR